MLNNFFNSIAQIPLRSLHYHFSKTFSLSLSLNPGLMKFKLIFIRLHEIETNSKRCINYPVLIISKFLFLTRLIIGRRNSLNEGRKRRLIGSPSSQSVIHLRGTHHEREGSRPRLRSYVID